MLTKFKRLYKHHWQHEPSAAKTLSPEVLLRLTQSVQSSEQQHSGEIRLYVEGALPLSYLLRDASMSQITRQRALAMFGKLRVWDTANNNGVLIYLLVAERAIEIVADRGLNDKVSTETWHALVATMRNAFKRGDFESGLSLAVKEVSNLLIRLFPLIESEFNSNELPDEPVVR
jgi:uncharacterized membrane protein